MSNKFSGTGVAIVTPFKSDGTVDTDALSKLTNHIIDNGVEYVVILGTTGESATLNKEEKSLVQRTIIEASQGRVPLVLGIGGNNTANVVDEIKAADFGQIDALLSVSPYYNKPTQAGIVQHYQLVADTSPVPVILYNVPGRTSSNMIAETTLKLAEHGNIMAVKEASGDLVQCMEIIKNKPDDFMVISGDDILTLPILSLGGNGVISVIANAFPKKFSDSVRHALSGNYDSAAVLHYELLDMMNAIFEQGNPGGVKAALNVLGITGDTMRLPLVNIDSELFDRIKALTAKLT